MSRTSTLRLLSALGKSLLIKAGVLAESYEIIVPASKPMAGQSFRVGSDGKQLEWSTSGSGAPLIHGHVMADVAGLDTRLSALEAIDSVPGPKGDKGDKGDTGLTGAAGAPGLKGDKGDTGAQGVPGIAGRGGAKGDKGDTGAEGVQGLTGLTGATGATGAKGDKGDTGPQGILGAPGVDAIGGAPLVHNHVIADIAGLAQIVSDYASRLTLLESRVTALEPIKLVLLSGNTLYIASPPPNSNWPTVTASSYYPGHEPWRVLDTVISGDDTSSNYPWASQFSASAETLTIDLRETKSINSIFMWGRTSPVSIGQNPKDFRIDVSVDNATWTTAVEAAEVTVWIPGQPKKYERLNVTGRYVRFTIFSSQISPNHKAISEIEIWGEG